MSDVGELDSDSSFFANVLAPGSSLNPTFLVIVHTAFFALFGVLTALAYLTSGNKHVLALIMIELALWATVYWFVSEIRSVQMESRANACANGRRNGKGTQGSVQNKKDS